MVRGELLAAGVLAATATFIFGLTSSAQANGAGQCTGSLPVTDFAVNYNPGTGSTFQVARHPIDHHNRTNAVSQTPARKGISLRASEVQAVPPQVGWEVSSAVVLAGFPLADFGNPSFGLTIRGQGSGTLHINTWFGPRGASDANEAAQMYSDGYSAVATTGPQTLSAATVVTPLNAAGAAGPLGVVAQEPTRAGQYVYLWIGVDIEAPDVAAHSASQKVAFLGDSYTGGCPPTPPTPPLTAQEPTQSGGNLSPGTTPPVPAPPPSASSLPANVDAPPAPAPAQPQLPPLPAPPAAAPLQPQLPSPPSLPGLGL